MDFLIFRGNDAAECPVFHGIPGETGHVFGGGIMIFIGHAIGIDKMGMVHADFLCLCVHVLCKGRKAAGQVFCDGCGGTVIGNHHHLVPKVVQGNPLSAVQGGGFHVSCISADADGFIGSSLFDGQDAGHDFCHTGGVFLFCAILFIENGPVFFIHNHRRIRRDFRRRRFDGTGCTQGGCQSTEQ